MSAAPQKSSEAFRTISEVAESLDTPAHVLRFWESKFTQIKPVKRAGGRRYYRPEDLALLAGIKALLHDQGMTIKGVQKLLREQGVKHVAAIAQDRFGAGLPGATLEHQAQPTAGLDLSMSGAALEADSEADGHQLIEEMSISAADSPSPRKARAPHRTSGILWLALRADPARLARNRNPLRAIAGRLDALQRRLGPA